MFVVDVIGHSGGLSLFWNDYVNIQLLSYSSGHVDVLYYINGTQVSCYLTGFYGNSIPYLRPQSWTT